jgi:hypothetical protein
LVQVCEPETERDLDDDDDDWDESGSADDLKYYRLGRKEEIPYGQEENEWRSDVDPTDCREGSQRISHCQLDNDERP